MSTQPNQAQPDQIEQGFSRAELEAFGVSAEQPQNTPAEAKPAGPSTEETLALMAQNMQEQNRQNQLLLDQLSRTPAPPQPAAEPKPGTGQIPVLLDEKNNLYIDPKALGQVAKGVVDEYHNQVVAPYTNTIQTVQQEQVLGETVNYLKQHHPDLMKDRDEKDVAGLVWGYFESPLNTGRTDAERTAWAVSKVQNAMLPSGNPTIREVAAANQVGRTAPGQATDLPYAPGSKITINRTSIAEMGLAAFNQSVQREAYLRDLSAAKGLNYQIEVKRPD